MKNISFDNPYLLLLAIPLALAVIIPFLICRSKDNRGVAWTLSLTAHLVIILLATLALAGLSSVTVLTKTTVYVVADVSHSSAQSLDEIDDYIAEIKKNLPENTSLGVICFGKNSVVLTPAGRSIKSVKEADVDSSATNIVAALEYTETLFEPDTIKRIVLITDGNDTTPQNQNNKNLAGTVERMTESGIKIDAIFLDNNLTEADSEVQLMDVEFSDSTYAGHENEAKFLIQSSRQNEARLTLYRRELAADGTSDKKFEEIGKTVITADQGLTTVRMSLPCDTAGSFEYKATVTVSKDLSDKNNTRLFRQTVIDSTRILLVTGRAGDVSLLEAFYGGNATIDSYVIGGGNSYAPFTLEDLIVYDEFIISNLDVRNIRNANAFLDSLDIAVSQYGKTLTALGNLHLQTNSEDRLFQKLEGLLPVNYGSTNRDGRMYTIVLDISHSMFSAGKFTIAKNTAIQLLSVLEADDYACLVTFSGDAVRAWGPKQMKEGKDDLVKLISGLETEHGTDIGLGLQAALNAVTELNLAENHVMVISDGVIHTSVIDDTVEASKKLYDTGATVSTVHTYIFSDGETGGAALRRIASAGEGGNYFYIQRPEDVNQVVFGKIADEMGEAIIEKNAPVNINRYRDDIVSGISSFPAVSGYVLSVEKYDATVPLTITHVRANGYQETIPLYAYRSHGNGRIAAFTSCLTDKWTASWSDSLKSSFMTNLIVSNTPQTRIDRPFTLKIERSEYNAYIEIVPSLLDPGAKATLQLTAPGRSTIRRELLFDSQKYFYEWATPTAGTYRIDVTYTYEGHTYKTTSVFEIPYLPEYNAFAPCDRYHVYEFIRNNGRITVGEVPSLEHDKTELTTYKMSYTIPLLIAAIVLFVIDILIRKLRLSKKKGLKTTPERKGANA